MESASRAPVPLFSDTTPPATAIPASATATSTKQPTHPDVDYTPLPWSGYFDQQHDITVPDTHDTFRLYTAGQHGQSHIGHSTGGSWRGCGCGCGVRVSL